MMKKHRKAPCNECPWRKEHPAGWLGGHPAEYFADSLRANEIHPCHQNDKGPDSDKSAMCAGALAVANNSCLQQHRTPNAIDAAKNVGKRTDCFAHYSLFYKHHTGDEYVMPFLREAP